MKKRLVGLMLGMAALTLVACNSKDEEIEVIDFGGSQVEETDGEISVEDGNTPGGEIKDNTTGSTTTNTTGGITVIDNGDGTIQNNTSFANPWVDSTKAEVLSATGFDLKAPEGAANIAYSYMPSTSLAQLNYVKDGAQWIYRMQKTAALEDISGMYYEWDYTGDTTVSGYPAKEYSYVDEDGKNGLRVINWYETNKGITHSLVISGADLNGMDSVVYAEELFLIGAPESDGIAPVDEELLKNYKETDEYKAFLGTHISTYDGSDITVTEKDNGKLKVDVGIFRLCTLDNGEGTYENGVVNFSAIDPSGEKIRCMLYFNENNSLCLIVEDSTWEYLPNGTIFEGFDD